MAAVIASHRARIADITDAVKAEREWEKAYGDARNRLDRHEALTPWQEARKHTDAMVSKHEREGAVDEAITVAALAKEPGWEFETDSNGYWGWVFCRRDIPLEIDMGPVAHRPGAPYLTNGNEPLEMENITTMRDLRELVRLLGGITLVRLFGAAGEKEV